MLIHVVIKNPQSILEASLIIYYDWSTHKFEYESLTVKLTVVTLLAVINIVLHYDV